MTLNTNLHGKILKNPLIMASGTFGFGAEYNEYFDVSKLGGICSKGLTLNPREGNLGTRVWETPSGMLNSVGLQNPGVRHFIGHELKIMRGWGNAVIANLGGSTVEDYIEGARLLDESDIDILELNISCPNVKEGGVAFGIKANIAHEVVSEVRKVVKHKPMMVKLSPGAENIVEMAKACEAAGADSISLINTLKGMAIDINTRKPVFRNVAAGLSGPCIKPVALFMTYEVCRNVNIPVVGIGGICNATDVIEFILAGATAVQIGTANFVKPDVSLDILADLEAWMAEKGLGSLDEIRGAAQL